MSRILLLVAFIIVVESSVLYSRSCLEDVEAQSMLRATLLGADGVRLFYRKVGKGKNVIVLLHGGPGSNMNAVWLDLEPLAGKHTVLMYDQRGGGRSEIIKDPAET